MQGMAVAGRGAKGVAAKAGSAAATGASAAMQYAGVAGGAAVQYAAPAGQKVVGAAGAAGGAAVQYVAPVAGNAKVAALDKLGKAGQAAAVGTDQAGRMMMAGAGAAGDYVYQAAAEKGLISKAVMAKEIAKARLLEMSAPARQAMLASLREMIKDMAIADPYMWSRVKKPVKAVLDHIFDDLDLEIEKNLKLALLKQQEDDDTDEHEPSIACILCVRFRACFLHHYLPHDRSIFGKLMDPIWWFITLVTFLPIYGIRVLVFSAILLMLLFPCPPNEFQLINFILIFKGTQFFTMGIVAMGMGALQYFVCFSWRKDALLQCIEQWGPGAFESLLGELLDYLGSILLVWIAFCALPFSDQAGPKRYVGERKRQEEELEESTCCFCFHGAKTRGGRLRSLLYYDMGAFLLTVLSLFVLTLATSWNEIKTEPLKAFSNAQFTANLYWCRVLYALLSCPFVIFVIPVLSTILTHSDPTGYNEHGECVLFELPADGLPKGAEVESDSEAETDEVVSESDGL